MATIGGCPLGICNVNGKWMLFDLPYYYVNVVTTSTEDIGNNILDTTRKE